MLEQKGLVKLVEECGEVIQIAAKKMTRMDLDTHWDGKGPISERMEEEIADLLAILVVVRENFDLSEEKIFSRVDRKVALFRQWMAESSDAKSGTGAI